MAEQSAIEWCDSTFNPWIGCTKVSPACDHCYAEALMDKRHGRVEWGKERDRTATSTWRQPRRWQKQAAAFMAEHGRRRRVFCASLADVFDNQVPREWRSDLWELIRACPDLDWLLLTKRPQNIWKMLPEFWDEIRGRVWLGTSTENQAEADRRLPHLLAVSPRPAVFFASAEPLLGPLNLSAFMWPVHGWWKGAYGSYRKAKDAGAECGLKRQALVGAWCVFLDWVITGGESGAGARPTSPLWLRSVRDQCAAAEVPYLHKQNGEWVSAGEIGFHGHESKPRIDMPPASMMRVGKKAAGRLLDGVTHDGFPQVRP